MIPAHADQVKNTKNVVGNKNHQSSIGYLIQFWWLQPSTRVLTISVRGLKS